MVAVGGSNAVDVAVATEARGIKVELGTLKEAEAPTQCADIRSMLLRPLATPTVNVDASASLVTVSTTGRVSTEDGSTREFDKVQILGLRPGVLVPGSIADIPFALALVEVPPAWTGDMQNSIGQLLVKGLPVIVVGDAVNAKPVVISFCDLVQEEITVINLPLFNTRRKIGSFRMAENQLCVLARELPSAVKFPRYLSFVEGSWPGVLPGDVVGYLFSIFVIEVCDLHSILVATIDPRLPAGIPTTLRHECNVVVGYLGNPESMASDFAVSLTARIKDADSLPTIPWDDVLHDFLMASTPTAAEGAPKVAKGAAGRGWALGVRRPRKMSVSLLINGLM